MRNCHLQRAVWMFFVYIMITYLFTIFFYVKSAVCLVRVQLNLALYFRFGIVSLCGRSKLRPISQRRKIRFLNSTKSMQDCEYIYVYISLMRKKIRCILFWFLCYISTTHFFEFWKRHIFIQQIIQARKKNLSINEYTIFFVLEFVFMIMWII